MVMEVNSALWDLKGGGEQPINGKGPPDLNQHTVIKNYWLYIKLTFKGKFVVLD